MTSLSNDGVQQWRRKQAEPRVIIAARYEPGKPLAGVIQVAKMAPGGRVAVAYLPRDTEEPDGHGHDPVLVAAWTDQHDSGPMTVHTVVAPGEYLAYDGTWPSLECENADFLNEQYEVIA